MYRMLSVECRQPALEYCDLLIV